MIHCRIVIDFHNSNEYLIHRYIHYGNAYIATNSCNSKFTAFTLIFKTPCFSISPYQYILPTPTYAYIFTRIFFQMFERILTSVQTESSRKNICAPMHKLN